ncbi:hyaluronan mediated motility receptor, putative, partial [Ixodes scapularis]
KVSLLEKQLNDSMHQKQDIIDELNQVKDLQHFLEDEAKELHQECDKLKTQAGQLEADLENDRLHIQKLEHELEDAETRDQQSFKELEALRASRNSIDLLQFEKQAVEEELEMEKIMKEKFNRDLAASNEQLALAKQRAEEVLAETTLQIAEFEKRLEDSSRNLSDRDEALQSAKIITLEAQLCTAKGQEDRLQSHMKALEEQMDELKRQLGAEKEQHANTAHQLDRMQKESKMHSLLDLEIADYERTVAELNNLLKEKNEELDNSRKEALTYQTKISDLVEHTGYLESQKKSDDERLLAFKDTVANLKEELAQSRRHEEELVRAEVRLESEIRAIQLREEETKLSFAELSRKCQSLEASLRSSRENHQRATKTLESKIASLKEVLATTQSELETTKAEFDNYKVRVHTVLKQQKKSTAPSGDASGGDSDAQEKMHSVIEQLRLRIKDLTEQLEVGQSEAEAAQEEYDKLAQRHQLVASELEAREREWKHRLEEALKQKTLEMGIELEKQLEQQYETLSSKFQVCHLSDDFKFQPFTFNFTFFQEHQSALESQQEAFEELKREMSELQQKLPTVQQDDVVPFDITTQERQDGEVYDSRFAKLQFSFTGSHICFKKSDFAWKHTHNQRCSNVHLVFFYSNVSWLTDELNLIYFFSCSAMMQLLNESESSNLRMTEQIRVLKEEIRRLERNQEREKHAQNLEYLKNIVMKVS